MSEVNLGGRPPLLPEGAGNKGDAGLPGQVNKASTQVAQQNLAAASALAEPAPTPLMGRATANPPNPATAAKTSGVALKTSVSKLNIIDMLCEILENIKAWFFDVPQNVNFKDYQVAKEDYKSAKKNYEELLSQKEVNQEELSQAKGRLLQKTFAFSSCLADDSDKRNGLRDTVEGLIGQDFEEIKKYREERQAQALSIGTVYEASWITEKYEGIYNPAMVLRKEQIEAMKPLTPQVQLEGAKKSQTTTPEGQAIRFLATMEKLQDQKKVLEQLKDYEKKVEGNLGGVKLSGLLSEKKMQELESLQSTLGETIRSYSANMNAELEGLREYSERFLSYLENCSVEELEKIFETQYLKGKNLTSVFEGLIASLDVSNEKSPAALLAQKLKGAQDFIAGIQNRMNDPQLKKVESAMGQVEAMCGAKAAKTKQHAALAAMQKFLREDARLSAFTDATKATKPEEILTCCYERQQALDSLPNFAELETKWSKGGEGEVEYQKYGGEIVAAFKEDDELREFLAGENRDFLKIDLLVQSFYAGKLEGLPPELKEKIGKFAEGHLTKGLLDTAKAVSTRLAQPLTLKQEKTLGGACGRIDLKMHSYMEEISEQIVVLGTLNSKQPLTGEEVEKLTSYWEKLSFLREEHEKLSKAYASLPENLKGPPLSETLTRFGNQLEGMEAALYGFLAPSGFLLTELKDLAVDIDTAVPDLSVLGNYKKAAALMQNPSFARFASLKQVLESIEEGQHEHLSPDAKKNLTELKELSAKAAVITPENLTKARQMAQEGIQGELEEVNRKLGEIRTSEELKDSLFRSLKGLDMLPQFEDLQTVEARTPKHIEQMSVVKKELKECEAAIEEKRKPGRFSSFSLESKEARAARIKSEIAPLEEKRREITVRLAAAEGEYSKDVDLAAKLRTGKMTQGEVDMWKNLGDAWVERYEQLKEFLPREEPQVDLEGWREASSREPVDPMELKRAAKKLHEQLTSFLAGAQFARGPVVLKTRKAALEIERDGWAWLP